MAYLQSGTVTWIHEEPSGKERYEIKQDRTANSKITYDPTGATATSDGYSGGTPCPPYTCSSPANNAMMAMTNRGFDGLERLTQMRNAEWLQSHQLEILTTPVGWVSSSTNPLIPNKVFPGPTQPARGKYDGFLSPIYGDFTLFLADASQAGGDGPACDSRLASIFGDDKSVVATAIDPAGILAPGSVARPRIGLPGEDPTKGIMHLYATATGGARSDEAGFIGNLYAPKGFDSLIGKADPVQGDSWDRNSNIQLYYKKGALSSFGYSGELTISMVHSGPIPKADRVPVPIQNSTKVNSRGSQLVGTIGADGSPYDGGGHGGLSMLQYDDPKLGVYELPVTKRSYVHSHLIFYAGRVGGKRIDPRTVFCSDLGFK